LFPDHATRRLVKGTGDGICGDDFRYGEFRRPRKNMLAGLVVPTRIRKELLANVFVLIADQTVRLVDDWRR
jgi:hypothetical protein